MRHPISEKQLAANQANAKKSTGPNTPRGQSVSSKNAIKHGFFSKTVLLLGENPERFLQLKNAYLRKFQPQDQDEFDLVDTLAANRWRLLRNWTFESISLNHQQRQQLAANGTEDPATQAMLARRAMDEPPRTQESINRHEVRLDRQYYKALDRLHRMIEAREIRAEKAASRAARQENCPEDEKIAKRSHELAENKLFTMPTHPMEKPIETAEQPKDNPFGGQKNPFSGPDPDPLAA